MPQTTVTESIWLEQVGNHQIASYPLIPMISKLNMLFKQVLVKEISPGKVEQEASVQILPTLSIPLHKSLLV